MRVRFKSREDEKVAAVHVLALLELLGGKATVEIIVRGEDKVYQVIKPAVSEAEQEGIPILVSPLFTFELVGRLYQKGISGMSPC
jgi:hypothetical protein